MRFGREIINCVAESGNGAHPTSPDAQGPRVVGKKSTKRQTIENYCISQSVIQPQAMKALNRSSSEEIHPSRVAFGWRFRANPESHSRVEKCTIWVNNVCRKVPAQVYLCWLLDYLAGLVDNDDWCISFPFRNMRSFLSN